MWASEYGKGKAVDTLLKAGADINASDKRQRNALYLAIAGNHEKVANQLLDAGVSPVNILIDGKSEIMLASEKMSAQTVMRLLRKGGDAGLRDKQGHDALWYAVDSGDAELVRLLLKGETDINRKDQRGFSLIHEAASGGSPEIVALLLDNGADVDVTASDGNTPLLIASSRGNAGVI